MATTKTRTRDDNTLPKNNQSSKSPKYTISKYLRNTLYLTVEDIDPIQKKVRKEDQKGVVGYFRKFLNNPFCLGKGAK